jgi:hypothetical protein
LARELLSELPTQLVEYKLKSSVTWFIDIKICYAY